LKDLLYRLIWVITDGKSSIFPKGIMIGRVAGYDVDSKTGHWDTFLSFVKD